MLYKQAEESPKTSINVLLHGVMVIDNDRDRGSSHTHKKYNNLFHVFLFNNSDVILCLWVWWVHRNPCYWNDPLSNSCKWSLTSFVLFDTTSSRPRNLRLRTAHFVVELILLSETFFLCCAFANFLNSDNGNVFSVVSMDLDRRWRWRRRLRVYDLSLYRGWGFTPFQWLKCRATSTVIAHSPRLQRLAMDSTLCPRLYDEII